MGDIPIVSLDRIYLEINNDSILFLDCTRLDGQKELVSRENPNQNDSVKRQIEEISKMLKDIGEVQIVLADDVVFSGSVLRSIITLFNDNDIEVIGIAAAIARKDSYDYFNSCLKYGIRTGFLMDKDVIDQICERDFYFGIAGSGISVSTGTRIVKAPYFIPFGNPVERASIPDEYKIYFSNSCINRSILLWQEIERLSQRTLFVRDLPEQIQNTSKDEEIINTLKKGLR